MNSYEALKEAVERVGAKKVASELRVSSSLVYKWCEEGGEEDQSGARNPLDRIRALLACTGDTGLVDWLCREAGGFFVSDPAVPPDRIDAEFVTRTQRMIQEFSELLHVVSRAMADDGRIDGAEARKIRREWQTLKAYAEAFVIACERGSFDS